MPGGRLSSVDVVSVALHYWVGSAARSVLPARAVSRLWSTAFGQFLELYVVPRFTITDEKGILWWTPHSADLLLVLLHRDDGLTSRLTTSILRRVRFLERPSPILLSRRCPSRLALPATACVYVKDFFSKGHSIETSELTKSEDSIDTSELSSLLELFPNVAELEVDDAENIRAVRRLRSPCLSLRKLRLEGAKRLGLSAVLDLPPTLEELLLGGPCVSSDSALSKVADRFPLLKALSISWNAEAMTTRACRNSLQRLRELRVLRIIGIPKWRDGSAWLPPFDENDILFPPLSTFVDELCSALPHLEEVCLAFVLQDQFPTAIGSLGNLRVLDVRGNRLPLLPGCIGSLVRLEELNLSGSPLRALPKELWNLTNLQVLFIDCCGLTSLPPEIGGLTALRHLAIGGYSLGTLPPELGQLKSLQRLQVNCSRLTALPAELCDLLALEELDIRYNVLDELPTQIGRLASLKRLLADSNRLTSLPAEIGTLRSLLTLSVAVNRLQALPSEAGQLAALECLLVGRNKLSSLPPEIGALRSLERLNIEFNQLTALPTQVCSLGLETLSARGNQLTTLPDEIGFLKALTKLDLAENQLSSLGNGIAGLTALRELCLHDNKLTSLPAALGKLKALRILSVQSNPIASVAEELKPVLRRLATAEMDLKLKASVTCSIS